MSKKQMIWTSDDYFNEDARMDYQESKRTYSRDEDYVVDDEEWADAVAACLNDERCNLNKEVDGVIIALADLGLWYGRRKGYQLMGNNVANILHSRHDAEWFGDSYNIRGIEHHHDGTNHILYRVAKDEESAQRIAEKIYTGQIDETRFRKMTRSLYPYVAAVYGWKVRGRKLTA